VGRHPCPKDRPQSDRRRFKGEEGRAEVKRWPPWRPLWGAGYAARRSIRPRVHRRADGTPGGRARIEVGVAIVGGGGSTRRPRLRNIIECSCWRPKERPELTEKAR